MGYGAYLEKQKCTHSFGLENKGKKASLQCSGQRRCHKGTLVFEEGPNEPFRSLTMLDLWLSAKSKLQAGGNRFLARTCSPPFPVHCSQELPLPTDPTRHHQAVLPLPTLPLAPAAPPWQQWRHKDFFPQTLGWWVTTQATLSMSRQLPVLGGRVDVPRGHYSFWVVPIVLLGVRGVV